MNLQGALMLLQKEVAEQVRKKVDLYYYEGYGVLCTLSGRPLHPANVIYMMPYRVLMNYLTRV
jgi:hypothetical protein